MVTYILAGEGVAGALLVWVALYHWLPWPHLAAVWHWEPHLVQVSVIEEEGPLPLDPPRGAP